MHISLTPQQEEWIQSLIKVGRYASTSEVMRHAIRLLQEESEYREVKMDMLREAVRKGSDEIERGDFSSKTIDQIITEVKNK